MKSDTELDQIAQAIRDSCQLTDPDYPRTRRRLLRSIQIDALREAREMIAPECKSMDGEDVLVISAGLEDALNKLIRELELR